ncbi:MAG: hypothetical protein ACI4IE_09190 [Eubacterium sp.]
MSLFNKNTSKPKTFVNTGRADLRMYTPEALQKIKAINAGVIILPNDASPEFMEAYGRIAKNAGSERYLSKDEDIVSVSGVAEFNCQNARNDAFYDISGITVLTHCKTENPIKITLSGISIYESDNNIQFEDCSGISHPVNFKIENTVIISADTEVNNDFIEELQDNTVVACGRNLSFNYDVDKDMLKSKTLYFLAGGNIKCPKTISGVVKTMATAGRKIEENG